MEINRIDVTFDTRSDSRGKDPDSASKTLKQYHKLLWSKHLPNGKMFSLDDKHRYSYLYHNSELGEYFLTSDGIIHTYSRWRNTQHIIKQVPRDEMKSFLDIACTVGGYLLFPGNKINNQYTMNQARGINKKINDRIDLTLECIRLYYQNETSPLFEVIKRYGDFFALFVDFKGYCEFFLLQDLVNEDYSKVNFFLPFYGFISNPIPRDLEEYNEYKKNKIEFIKKRNQRIDDYNKQLR
jgi:hypothetical protein